MLANKVFTFIMFDFKVICWALLFIFKLRFPPGVSIATVLMQIIIVTEAFRINKHGVFRFLSLTNAYILQE
jgi:hypothetical protein